MQEPGGLVTSMVGDGMPADMPLHPFGGSVISAECGKALDDLRGRQQLPVEPFTMGFSTHPTNSTSVGSSLAITWPLPETPALLAYQLTLTVKVRRP